MSILYRNTEAVKEFLASHPETEKSLKEALPAVAASFGVPVDIILEVIIFPKKGVPDQLIGWIQSTDSVEEGLEKLDKFDDEWFLDNMPDGLSFNVETRTP